MRSNILITIFIIVVSLFLVASKLTAPARLDSAISASVRKYRDTVTIMGDSSLGSLIFQTPEFTRSLAAEDTALTYLTEPDPRKRIEALASGKASMIVMSLPTWLTLGTKMKFPGVIGFVTSESTKAQAIVTLDPDLTIQDLAKPGIKGAVIPNSAASFFLSQVAASNNIVPDLIPLDHSTADNSLTNLLHTHASYIVLSEPLLSRVLNTNPKARVLANTANTMPIEVAIFNPKLIVSQPKLTALITSTYFKELHTLLRTPLLFTEAVRTFSNSQSTEQTESILASTVFPVYLSNIALWFENEELLNNINAVSKVLLQSGEIDSHPLPSAYSRLVNRLILDTIGTPNPVLSKYGQRPFKPLSPLEWQVRIASRIRDIYSLTLSFSSGSTELPNLDRYLQEWALTAALYPDSRILIEVKVPASNDPEADIKLSNDRAQFLYNALAAAIPDGQNRVFAQGLGSSNLPPRNPHETLRQWERRCRIVTISILPH